MGGVFTPTEASVVAVVYALVVDHSPDIVASGPVSPDPTRFADAVGVLKRYGLWKQVPLAARGWLVERERDLADGTTL